MACRAHPHATHAHILPRTLAQRLVRSAHVVTMAPQVRWPLQETLLRQASQFPELPLQALWNLASSASLHVQRSAKEPSTSPQSRYRHGFVQETEMAVASAAAAAHAEKHVVAEAAVGVVEAVEQHQTRQVAPAKWLP